MTFATLKDFRYVEEIVQQAHSSFALGMKALPEGRRGYLFAIYAYCRVLDDIADEEDLVENKIKDLQDWRDKVDQLIAGHPSCAITRILADAITLHHIPINELYLLIDGMEADAKGPIQSPTWDELYKYCRQVAVSVGLLSLPIFGRTDKGAQDFGLELGYALQLTNILRDVEEDWEIDRLYVPAIYGVSDITSPNLSLALGEMAEKVEGHYQKADQILSKIGRDNLKPALMMMVVYRKLFEKMKKRGWQTITPRMRLSKAEKALSVMKCLATT